MPSVRGTPGRAAEARHFPAARGQRNVLRAAFRVPSRPPPSTGRGSGDSRRTPPSPRLCTSSPAPRGRPLGAPPSGAEHRGLTSPGFEGRGGCRTAGRPASPPPGRRGRPARPRKDVTRPEGKQRPSRWGCAHSVAALQRGLLCEHRRAASDRCHPLRKQEGAGSPEVRPVERRHRCRRVWSPRRRRPAGSGPCAGAAAGLAASGAGPPPPDLSAQTVVTPEGHTAPPRPRRLAGSRPCRCGRRGLAPRWLELELEPHHGPHAGETPASARNQAHSGRAEGRVPRGLLRGGLPFWGPHQPIPRWPIRSCPQGDGFALNLPFRTLSRRCSGNPESPQGSLVGSLTPPSAGAAPGTPSPSSGLPDVGSLGSSTDCAPVLW